MSVNIHITQAHKHSKGWYVKLCSVSPDIYRCQISIQLQFDFDLGIDKTYMHCSLGDIIEQIPLNTERVFLHAREIQVKDKVEKLEIYFYGIDTLLYPIDVHVESIHIQLIPI